MTKYSPDHGFYIFARFSECKHILTLCSGDLDKKAFFTLNSRSTELKFFTPILAVIVPGSGPLRCLKLDLSAPSGPMTGQHGSESAN